MRALVTAAGTSEPIDDVRVLTNLSTGRLGAAIANRLVARGHSCTLLAGRALAGHAEWIDPRVRIVPFGAFADLADALRRHTDPPPDALFMAAAVSDYSPVRVDGKLRSDADELTLVLKRNPKLLSGLRARCGGGTVLCGFKLLSGVTRDELVAVARRQVVEARLDLCLANDQRRLTASEHPAVLVPVDGDPIDVGGSKDDVAGELVAWVERARAAVEAVSVCAVDDRGRVLIGRRRRGPGEGAWAFPGGRVEAGETLRVAGLREVREETGVVLSGEVADVHLAYVDGDPGYRIRCLVVRETAPADPVPTDELDAQWMPIDEARALRPLTEGTRRVLGTL